MVIRIFQNSWYFVNGRPDWIKVSSFLKEQLDFLGHASQNRIKRKVIVRFGWKSVCVPSRSMLILYYKDFSNFGRECGILTPLSWRESKFVTKNPEDISNTF